MTKCDVCGFPIVGAPVVNGLGQATCPTAEMCKENVLRARATGGIVEVDLRLEGAGEIVDMIRKGVRRKMPEGGDRLVVGRQAFVKDVAIRLHATDEHSCEQETRPDYKAMAKAMWDAGYRFDPEARKAWLVLEMRSRLSGNQDLSDMLGEMLGLFGYEG